MVNVDEAPRSPWDRLPGESPRGYELFRRFRDLGPLRQLDMLTSADMNLVTLRRWQNRNDWRDRAAAWDDEVHRQQDARRLELIRTMHDNHQRAGHLAIVKAIEALRDVDARDIPPYAAARLLELGARLERDTLVVSVEELQGQPPLGGEDPWESISRELDALPSS